MTDTNAVLIEYLRATSTSLYTLVGTRIYCPRIPAAFANAQPALEVMRRGGSSKREHSEHSCSFQIKCYGGSANYGDAEAVYRALYDRLQNAQGQNTTSGNIMMCREEFMGQSIFDPDTGWPCVLSFWNVTIRPKA
jgi:hypothetical protein